MPLSLKCYILIDLLLLVLIDLENLHSFSSSKLLISHCVTSWSSCNQFSKLRISLIFITWVFPKSWNFGSKQKKMISRPWNRILYIKMYNHYSAGGIGNQWYPFIYKFLASLTYLSRLAIFIFFPVFIHSKMTPNQLMI